MFKLAYLIGLFSYIILFLGLRESLSPFYVTCVLSLFLIVGLVILNKQIESKRNISKKLSVSKFIIKSPRLLTISLTLLIIQVCVNLIGVLGPELSFDALWYHLTLPKIYLVSNSVHYIPGGLLYYSTMPQLGEMIYSAALMFSNEIATKFIHFLFGLLVVISIYLFSNEFFQKKYAAVAALIFYSNLVVGWESISGNIDLIRAFFEILAVWAFATWVEKKNTQRLLATGVMLGFAIATKLLALGSLAIFLLLIIYVNTFLWKTQLKNIVKSMVLLTISSLAVASPWLVRSFLISGNPVYPFFSKSDPVDSALVTFYLPDLVNNTWTLLMKSADPISPIYIIVIPIVVLLFNKFSNLGKILTLYSMFGILLSIPTAKLGGGRFILAYLPALSICVGYLLSRLESEKQTYYYKILLSSVILTSLISIGYRGVANAKFLPVVIGIQSRDEFLSQNLNFKFGDFYDTDGFFKKSITESDRVLLIGFHNLYYVNFPFIHESYLKEGDKFNYIAVQNGVLPKEYNNWHPVYSNETTGVKLYKRGKFVAKK